VVQVFDLRLKCLGAVLSFRRAVNLDDLGFRGEGLGNVHKLAFSFLFEGLVVGFPALVVPGDIVLMVFVDAFGVGSKMSSLCQKTEISLIKLAQVTFARLDTIGPWSHDPGRIRQSDQGGSETVRPFCKIRQT
jgi:hypothetical protein